MRQHNPQGRATKRLKQRQLSRNGNSTPSHQQPLPTNDKDKNHRPNRGTRTRETNGHDTSEHGRRSENRHDKTPKCTTTIIAQKMKGEQARTKTRQRTQPPRDGRQHTHTAPPPHHLHTYKKPSAARQNTDTRLADTPR